MTRNFTPLPTQCQLDPHLRNLMRNAKRGRKHHAAQLMRKYRIKVYTAREIEHFVQERPELLTAEIIGNSEWDARKAQFEV